MFRVSPVPMAVTRVSDGRILEVNAAALRLFGWSRAEAIGRATTELGVWNDAEERERLVRRFEEQGQVDGAEVSLRSRDGEVYHVLASGVAMTLDGEACMLSILTDISERKAGEEELRRLAMYDHLTELPNRSEFVRRLRRALSDEDRPVAVLFADLDRFKQVNDTLGHAAGDELLSAVAERLSRCFRDEDTVARFGGDEFGVLLADVDEVELVRAARRMVDAVAEPFALGDRLVRTGLSVGAALDPEGVREPDALIRAADEAMYRAKARGGGGYELCSPARPEVPSTPEPGRADPKLHGAGFGLRRRPAERPLPQRPGEAGHQGSSPTSQPTS